MSSTGQNTQQQQLNQDIQHELTTANQLLRLISKELEQIKQFTSLGGEFESTIKKNATLMRTLASLQQIDIENIPPMSRNHLNITAEDNLENVNHNTEMEES